MANARSNLTLSGDKVVKNLLRELPGRVEKKGLRAAVNAGSAPIARAMKAKAPRRSGLLKKSIGRKVKTYRRSVVAIIGARRSIEGVVNRRRQVPANYIHLVDKGVKPHRQSKGQHPGFKGTGFVAAAYKETKSIAGTIATGRMRKVVIEEARKLGKV